MNGKNVALGILLLLVLAGIGYGAYLLGKGKTPPPPANQEQPQASPEASPAAAPQTPPPAPETTTFSVQSVVASVSPQSANVCPGIFNFSAVIAVNAAGTVKYYFERSDGSTGAAKTLTFTAGGSQTVKDSWTLSASTSGWERVHITAPNVLISNQAKFNLSCPTAFAVTAVNLTVTPDSSDVCQPATTFSAAGRITLTQPGTITYRWERSDGNGANQSVVATGTTQTVSDTWNLNSAGNYWYKLHVLTPTDAVTSQANISLTCPFRVNSITASADPSSFSGSCPKTINFSAVLSSNAAGTVSYKWARSDNASSATQTLNFSGPGTQTVTDSWSLGSAGNSYNNWERVDVSSPNTISSNQANFSLTCL